MLTDEEVEIDVDTDKNLPCESIRQIGDTSFVSALFLGCIPTAGCPNPAEWVYKSSSFKQLVCDGHKVFAEQHPEILGWDPGFFVKI